MRIGSLFSGYGGLDLAALEMFPDSEVVWHCEWDAAPSRILEHHWPGVPNLHDVTQVDWTQVEPVDVLTGGYPCQPFSAAGRRQGTNDERHLWPYVREAIRHLRPRFTLLENVAGHRSLGFDRVLGDLAEDGFDAEWTSVRASDIGAPHHRERLFILVHAADTDSSASRPNTRRDSEPRENTPHLQSESRRDPTPGMAPKPTADDHSIGCGQGTKQPVASLPEKSSNLCGVGAFPNSTDNRRERSGQARDGWSGPTDGGSGVEWGKYAPAVRRWERVTRSAPTPTELNSNGRPRLNAAFAEWMMGLPAGWVTGVPGLSRAEQLKAIGNGVCPQQAVAAYSSLLDVEAAA